MSNPLLTISTPVKEGKSKSTVQEDVISCGICTASRPVNPHMCRFCSKVGCKVCMVQSLKGRNTCPYCRHSQTEPELVNVRWLGDQLGTQTREGSNASCSEHQKDIVYFCTDCKQSQCSDCGVLSTTHQGHTIAPLLEAVKVYKTTAKETILSLHDKKQYFADKMLGLQRLSDQVDKLYQESMGEITYVSNTSEQRVHHVMQPLVSMLHINSSHVQVYVDLQQQCIGELTGFIQNNIQNYVLEDMEIVFEKSDDILKCNIDINSDLEHSNPPIRLLVPRTSPVHAVSDKTHQGHSSQTAQMQLNTSNMEIPCVVPETKEYVLHPVLKRRVYKYVDGEEMEVPVPSIQQLDQNEDIFCYEGSYWSLQVTYTDTTHVGVYLKRVTCRNVYETQLSTKPCNIPRCTCKLAGKTENTELDSVLQSPTQCKSQLYNFLSSKLPSKEAQLHMIYGIHLVDSGVDGSLRCGFEDTWSMLQGTGCPVVDTIDSLVRIDHTPFQGVQTGTMQCCELFVDSSTVHNMLNIDKTKKLVSRIYQAAIKPSECWGYSKFQTTAQCTEYQYITVQMTTIDHERYFIEDTKLPILVQLSAQTYQDYAHLVQDHSNTQRILGKFQSHFLANRIHTKQVHK